MTDNEIALALRMGAVLRCESHSVPRHTFHRRAYLDAGGLIKVVSATNGRQVNQCDNIAELLVSYCNFSYHEEPICPEPDNINQKP